MIRIICIEEHNNIGPLLLRAAGNMFHSFQAGIAVAFLGLQQNRSTAGSSNSRCIVGTAIITYNHFPDPLVGNVLQYFSYRIFLIESRNDDVYYRFAQYSP